MTMKFYYRPGSCALSCHIVLEELGIDCEPILVSDEMLTSAEYREINPRNQVPALITDEGDIITENPAVLQYLADQSPEAGLAPANGTLERTRLQAALNFVSSELHKSFGPFFSGKELDSDARQKAEAGVARRAAYVEQSLSDGRTFLLGETFSVADAYAFVVLNWAGFVGVSLDAFPKTQAYVARIAVRPAAIKAMVAEGLMEQAA